MEWRCSSSFKGAESVKVLFLRVCCFWRGQQGVAIQPLPLLALGNASCLLMQGNECIAPCLSLASQRYSVISEAECFYWSALLKRNPMLWVSRLIILKMLSVSGRRGRGRWVVIDAERWSDKFSFLHRAGKLSFWTIPTSCRSKRAWLAEQQHCLCHHHTHPEHRLHLFSSWEEAVITLHASSPRARQEHMLCVHQQLTECVWGVSPQIAARSSCHWWPTNWSSTWRRRRSCRHVASCWATSWRCCTGKMWWGTGLISLF